MSNQSAVNLHSVQEIPMLYKRLFGEELDFYDMLEILPLVLKKTGSMAIKQFLFRGQVKDFKLELPCNVYAIRYACESKPASWYDRYIQNQSEYLINYDVKHLNEDPTYQAPVATVYELNKNIFSEPLGRLVDFENENNKCLHFNYRELDVDVLYIFTPMDADGYPRLPEKTLEAVAHYCWYLQVRKDYYKGRANGEMLSLARDEKDVALAQGRTPEYISDNERDDLLNVITSHNRKVHNLQSRR
jgi:hypothetical protein